MAVKSELRLERSEVPQVVDEFLCHYPGPRDKADELFHEARKWIWLSAQPDAAPFLDLSLVPRLAPMLATFVGYPALYADYCQANFGRGVTIEFTPPDDGDSAARLRGLVAYVLDNLGRETALKWFSEWPDADAVGVSTPAASSPDERPVGASGPLHVQADLTEPPLLPQMDMVASFHLGLERPHAPLPAAASPLEELDAVHDGPFGCSLEIMGRCVDVYERVLRGIDLRLRRGDLTRALDALSRGDRWFALRSAAVRCLANRLRAHVENGKPALDLYEKVVAALTVSAAAPEDWKHRRQAAGYDVAQPLTEPYPFIVTASVNGTSAGDWDEAGELAGMVDGISQRLGAEPCVMRPLEDADVWALQGALGCLQEVSPMVARDVVLNLRHVVRIDYARWPTMADDEPRDISSNCSTVVHPGVCYLSGETLRSRSFLVEALYHEALHNKLYNLQDVRRIFPRDFHAAGRPHFVSPWNEDRHWRASRWDAGHALFAFHVYAHLRLLYREVGARAVTPEWLPRTWCQERLRICQLRAAALSRWLQAHAAGQLEPDGLSLLDLLTRTLDT